MLLLLAIHAGSSPASSSSSPSSPSPLPFFSFASLAELWWWRSSSVPSILLLTLLVVLLTSLTLHLLSPSSDPSPSSLLHKYRYRHDGYLSYAPSRCTLPPSATLSTFHPSPPSTRTLRTLHLHPLPRPGNALPSPPRPRAVLLWLPPLHSHALHSAGLLQHVAYVGDAVVAIDWWGMGKDRVGGMGGGRAEAWEWEGVVEEVGECAAEVQRGYAGVPLFIGGESFGASIAMAAALKRPHLYTGMVSAHRTPLRG